MKRLSLICIIILMCCLKCHAQGNVESVAFSIASDTNYIDDISSIWNAMKEGCRYVFFCENGEVKQEKGGNIYRKDNLWYFLWYRNVFDDDEMKKMFDNTIYNNAICEYSGESSEVKELIYDSLYRVFALTEENIYVITGYDEVWNNAVDDLEVCSLITWKEMYSESIPVRLYVNDMLIDETAYIGKYNTLIPLRAVLESMGKSVEWIEEEQEVIINNNICLKLDNMNKIMTASYINSDLSIQMADWSNWCSYSVLEDRIYLSDISIGYLTRQWNYDINLNIPKREVQICDNAD